MAYYVLGSGGAKYGPVDLDTLAAWVGQGRVTAETLVEDAGSGVKSPARALRGLAFPVAATPPATPDDGHSAVIAPQSNYVRPGQGTGGSANNLFLPPSAQAEFQPANLDSKGLFLPTGTGPHLKPSSSLFLPNVDAKWAWHGFACVGTSLLCGAIVGLSHWYVGKLLIFAFALPLFGVQRGYRGLGVNRPLATVVIVLNVIALLGTIAFVFRGMFF